MEFATKLLSGAALAVALSNTASAATYNIVDTLGTYKFDLMLTTAADATSTAQAITAISGTFDGQVITKLGNVWWTQTFLADADPTKWFDSFGIQLKYTGVNDTRLKAGADITIQPVPMKYVYDSFSKATLVTAASNLAKQPYAHAEEINSLLNAL